MPLAVLPTEDSSKKTSSIIDGYFRRIGYDGGRSPSLETLAGIHRAHTRAIPFENLSPLLRLPVSLDINSIYEKVVEHGRGGYCFEQNILFNYVLTNLGFETTGLAARVMWNVPEGVTPARGHMLLLVKIKGSGYIADTGFGGLTLPEPVALTTEVAQKTSHEAFRFLIGGTEYILQARVKDEWKSLYRFTLTEQLLPDYEISSYYLSTHPSSHFTYNLVAARVDHAKRFALKNRDFTIHQTDGPSTSRQIESVEELKLLLENVFHIQLPKADHLDETLGRIISG